MAKKNKWTDDEEIMTSAEQVSALMVEPIKKEEKETVVLISFDRYFSSLGRPNHHKAGMMAFTNTSGKKTVAAWDAMFKKY